MQKVKTANSLRNISYSAKLKMNLQKRNNLCTRERLQGAYLCEIFNPLGISNEFLFRNNFNDQKMHFIRTRKIFPHSKGNHFPAG